MNPCNGAGWRTVALAVCLSLSAPVAALTTTDRPAEPPLLLAQAPAAPAPGQFEVDEEAAERALERTLVTTGALLLPPGKAELEPAFAYIRNEGDTPVAFTQGGAQFIAQETVGTDILEASVLVRLGLRGDMQLEADVPYRRVDEERVTLVGFQPAAASDARRNGAGDIRIGVAKALLAPAARGTTLVGRITWDTATGDDDGDQVPLGGYGAHELAFSLSATRRQDPLVFNGSVFFQKAFEEDDIKAGDEIGFSFGALLAASPETSLRVAFDHTVVREAEVAGARVSGSDATIGSVLFGASSIIGAGRFLDFSIQIGVSEDAPAYALGLAYSTRFDAGFGGG